MAYSEGIFEDMNKAVVMRHYYNTSATAQDTIREYVSYEFGDDRVVEAVKLLEMTWSNITSNTSAVRLANSILESVDRSMSNRTKSRWRWRLLLLRSKIDVALLKTNETYQGNALRRYFEELTKMYYAENADPNVKPPVVPPSNVSHDNNLLS